MRHTGAIAAAAASLLLAGGASAADAPPFGAPIAPPPPQVVEPAGFDWGGPYLGVLGGAHLFFEDGFQDVDILATFVAGFNFVPNRLLFGLSVFAGPRFDTDPLEYNDWALGVDARIGLPIGDSLLVYTFAGLYDYSPLLEFPGDLDFHVGAGTEFAIAESLTLVGQIAVGRQFDAPESLRIDIQAGLNWFPGR